MTTRVRLRVDGERDRLARGGGRKRITARREAEPLRQPRADEGHLAKDVKCLIHTTDGKFVAVKEDCKTMAERLDEIYHRRESIEKEE